MNRRILAFALLPVLASAPAALRVGAQSDLLPSLFHAEFWAESEPVSGTGDPWPVSPEERERRIRDEAAWIYSGMIWGFEFSYTPYDKVRRIQERFDITSLGSIQADDAGLAFGPARVGPDETRAFVAYHPLPAEEARVESYGAEPWRSAQGIGHASNLLGWKGRRASYEDGLRVAVRELLRLLEPNKPRLVRGRVVFERVPTITVMDGAYTCQVRARVEVSDILRYELY